MYVSSVGTSFHVFVNFSSQSLHLREKETPLCYPWLYIEIRLQKLLSVQICLNMFGSKCRIVQVFLQRVEDITILDHSHWALDGTRFAAPLFFFVLEKVFKWFESGEVALQNVQNEFTYENASETNQAETSDRSLQTFQPHWQMHTDYPSFVWRILCDDSW